MDAESSGRDNDRQRTYSEIYEEHLLVTVQQWERDSRVGCLCAAPVCGNCIHTHKHSARKNLISDWTGFDLSL